MASVIPRRAKETLVRAYLLEPWNVVLLNPSFLGVYDAATHEYYADVSGYECASAGYTAGGIQLDAYKYAWNQAGTGYNGDDVVMDSLDVTWTGVTFTGANAVRYAVTYNRTTGELRDIYEFNADQAVTAGTFTVQWNAVGMFKITG